MNLVRRLFGFELLHQSVLAMTVFALCAGAAWAQNSTTGAISGTVSDATGAVVPAANITATNVQNGIAHSAVSQGNGGYVIPLLQPGTYNIAVERTGFETAKQAAVIVAVGSNVAVNIKLRVGQTAQTVEVTGAAPLLEPKNPNISTTLDTTAIADLPNPGNDLTYLAQVAPGATITKNGAYYNAYYNGLPGTTSNFTVDGGSYNDPFLAINNSGPTNLSLGVNDIQEVTVASNPYSVDQGHAEGANVNYVSKHGGNSFHGNLMYQWNGRVLNAYDTFSESAANASNPLGPKPFDNVNNYAGSFGGPIMHNKMFFFVDDEGAQIDLPVVTTGVIPTAAYETYAQQQLLVGGCETDPVNYFNPTAGGGTAPATGNCAVNGATQPGVANGENGNYLYLPPQPAEAAFQKHELGLYVINNPKLEQSPVSTFGCNLDPKFVSSTNPLGIDPSFNPQVAGGQAAGDANLIPSDTGCANNVVFNGSNNTWENKLIARYDYNPNQNNSFWFSYTNDRGLQATGLSPDNPIFNQDSFQPEWGTNGDWTHVFSPTVVNDLSFSQLWYGAPFTFADQSVVNAESPYQFNSPWDTLGSTGFPQGRNVTNFGLFDNLNILKGAHQFRLGVNFLREWITDFDFEGSIQPNITAGSFAEFDYGVASGASISYPTYPDQPVRIYTMEAYAGDTWQITPHFTFIYGVRLSNDSDPRDPYGSLGNPVDWETMNHGIGVSPASVIFPSTKLFNHVPLIFPQPRFAFSWQPRTNTLIQGGWGMFEALAPADAIDSMARNAPFDPSYSGGSSPGDLGQVPTDGSAVGPSAAGCPFAVMNSGNPQCGVLYDPSQTFSVVNAMANANQIFQTNFAAKSPSCIAPGASATACIPQQRLTIQPQQGLSEPYAEEWSFGITQQVSRTTAVNLNYVGNRSLHNEDTVDPNSYETLCNGCFAPYVYSPSATAPDPRFTSISQDRYDGITTYNAMQAGLTQHVNHGLTLGLNYAWSHSLQTNAAFSDSSGLTAGYRTQSGIPYNVLSANYTYQLPWRFQNSFLGSIFNNWQVSGATFSQSGDPLFISTASESSVLHNATGPDNPAYWLSGVSPYSINDNIAADNNTQGVYQYLNPAAFMSTYNSHGKKCVNPATLTYATASAAICQFPDTYGFHLFGPGFQWSNLFVTKKIQLSERMTLQVNAEAYNLFNHPNYANPSTTAPVPGVSSSYVNAGTINSLDAPSTGLLGNGLGGDSAPRMIAFEGRLVF